MGYFEPRCTLCNVPFNIGRIRRADEARECGWGGEGNREYVPAINWGSDNCEEGSCFLVKRERNDEESGDDEKGNEEDEKSGQSQEDREHGDEADAENEDEDRDDEFPDIFLPLSTIDPDEDEALNRADAYEHITGQVDCKNEGGYNGFLISTAEMRGSQVFQAIVQRQEDDFSDSMDEHPVEKGSKYWISSLGDRMTSPDWDNPELYEGRKHLESVNVSWPEYVDVEFGERYGIVVHPTCLDIFIRVCMKRLGHVDLNGLGSLHEAERGQGSDFTIKNDRLVSACVEQAWRHRHGTEYCAANPLFVPGLSTFLHSAVATSTLEPHDGVFTRKALFEPAMDPFTQLPQELRQFILADLSSRDIANLRHSSRCFHQLPMHIFRHLTQSEMPWLWEIFDPVAEPWWGATVYPQDSEKEYENIEDLKAEVPLSDINWFSLFCAVSKNLDQFKGLKNRKRIWRAVDDVVCRIQTRRDQGLVED